MLGTLFTISSFATANDELPGKRTTAPWTRTCADFTSGNQFVSESSLFCLRQPNQRVCHEQAEGFFQGCRFQGKYQRISKRIHAKMLIVLALAGTPQQGNDESL